MLILLVVCLEDIELQALTEFEFVERGNLQFVELAIPNFFPLPVSLFIKKN